MLLGVDLRRFASGPAFGKGGKLQRCRRHATVSQSRVMVGLFEVGKIIDRAMKEMEFASWCNVNAISALFGSLACSFDQLFWYHPSIRPVLIPARQNALAAMAM